MTEELKRRLDEIEARYKQLEAKLAAKSEALEKLWGLSINFLSRARECCVELNPNNYHDGLLWKAEGELGKYLDEIRHLCISDDGGE